MTPACAPASNGSNAVPAGLFRYGSQAAQPSESARSRSMVRRDGSGVGDSVTCGVGEGVGPGVAIGSSCSRLPQLGRREVGGVAFGVGATVTADDKDLTTGQARRRVTLSSLGEGPCWPESAVGWVP